MTAALLLLAGCGTYVYDHPNRAYTNTIHGTVDYVDAASRTIVLYEGRGDRSMRVYYDDRTPVFWQGRDYRPEDLQRGDQVDLTMRETRYGLMAQAATVTYNANNAAPPAGPYPSTPQGSLIRGTVRYIDTNSRTIAVDSNNTLITVSYDPALRVDVNGQLYPLTNLERGDVVEVQTQSDPNGGNLFASRITLIRDVRR